MKRSRRFSVDSLPALTSHALFRMNNRHISPLDVAAVLDYGRSYRVRGAVVYAMGRREVASCRGDGMSADRIAGLQVVCSPDDDVVITVYRNSDFRSLRRRETRKSPCK